MSKQTAVEWLLHALHASGFIEDITDPLLIQRVNEAKAMEREQIVDAHLLGLIHSLEKEVMQQALEYYNETYGKEASHE